MRKDWRDELFDERSFWSLYWKAARFGDTVFNRCVRWITIVLLLGFVLANEYVYNRQLLSLEAMRENIRNWSADGIQFTTQLLGFLVAGFTIFATLTKADVFKKLAITPHPKTSVSSLKFIFFNFMSVFAHYVAFLAACLTIKMFFAKSAAGTAVLHKIADLYPSIKIIVVYCGFVFLGAWFINLVIILKSFVWNMYISVLLVIASESE